MSIELKVPALGESINEVEIGDWLKKEGEFIEKDQPIVVLESEKATVELPAPASGLLEKIGRKKGETAAIGETIGYITPDDSSGRPKADNQKSSEDKAVAPAAEQKPIRPAAARSAEPTTEVRVMPAAQRILAESGMKGASARATGPGNRLLKEDALRDKDGANATASPEPSPPVTGTKTQSVTMARQEEVVRMSRLRRTVAERLVKAHRDAALLTTFNEIDMSAVMNLRKEYGDAFRERYGAKLGFMSFFVKAVIEGLKNIPQLNAEIRDADIIYKNYFDIGVAIGGGKGLVVPVLRNAEQMSFGGIELAIHDLATRAKENKLRIEELEGGTFTITNGGVYGSLLSTPIVNPPQSGVLGMHAIQERPIAQNGAVVIRPMMYVALTYDHRIVDGREAVTFLKRVKEVIENPTRMLIEI